MGVGILWGYSSWVDIRWPHCACVISSLSRCWTSFVTQALSVIAVWADYPDKVLSLQTLEEQAAHYNADTMSLRMLVLPCGDDSACVTKHFVLKGVAMELQELICAIPWNGMMWSHSCFSVITLTKQSSALSLERPHYQWHVYSFRLSVTSSFIGAHLRML